MECDHSQLYSSPPLLFCFIKTFLFKNKRETNYKQTVSCLFPRSLLDEYLLLNLNRQIKGKELARF